MSHILLSLYTHWLSLTSTSVESRAASITSPCLSEHSSKKKPTHQNLQPSSPLHLHKYPSSTGGINLGAHPYPTAEKPPLQRQTPHDPLKDQATPHRYRPPGTSTPQSLNPSTQVPSPAVHANPFHPHPIHHKSTIDTHHTLSTKANHAPNPIAKTK